MKTGAITPQDTWETELNGMFTGGAVDSKAPVTVNCSSHWFDAKNNVAAVGWYEQGVRFLSYRNPTDIQQVGYYIPANGSTWAAYWSPTDPNGEVVYTADAYRGVDVLKIDGGGDDRQEGQGAGAERVVRERSDGQHVVLRLVRVAPDLRVRLPGAEAGRRHAVVGARVRPGRSR